MIVPQFTDHRRPLRRLRRPSPAIIVASVALFFALAGSTVSAAASGKTSASLTSFSLREAHRADLAYERAYWRGSDITVKVPDCWWIHRKRVAACLVLTTGSFFTGGGRATFSGNDHVVMRHHRLIESSIGLDQTV
jgi:hypothetical protein